MTASGALGFEPIPLSVSAACAGGYLLRIVYHQNNGEPGGVRTHVDTD